MLVPYQNILERERANYIITTSSYNISRFDKGAKEYETFEKLINEKTRYQLIFEYPSKTKCNLNIEDILSDLDQRYISGKLNKINSEIFF